MLRVEMPVCTDVTSELWVYCGTAGEETMRELGKAARAVCAESRACFTEWGLEEEVTEEELEEHVHGAWDTEVGDEDGGECKGCAGFRRGIEELVERVLGGWTLCKDGEAEMEWKVQ
jgi:hypothetical protein